MKIIISPSGSFSLKREYLEKLFECCPELFDEAMPAVELRLEGQSDEELLDWYESAVLRETNLHFLKESSAEVRTSPVLIHLLETHGGEALAGKFCSQLKIVEIPDGIEWYRRAEEDGSESIHERHRVWN